MLPAVRTRRRAFLIAILLAVVVAVLWLVFQPRPAEPMAGGKPLDYWLNALAVAGSPTPRIFTRAIGPAAPTNEMNYDDALRQVGPQALPFILRKLGTNDSPLRNWYRVTQPKLPDWLKKRLPENRPIAFSVSEAQSAIYMAVTNDAERIRLLLPAARNHNPAIREVAITLLNPYNGQSLSTNEFMDVYRRAARDPDPSVRIHAIITLGRAGRAASNAVPELVDALHGNETGRHRESKERVYVRANAALTLGHIGPAAGGALPALTNLMATGDGYQRIAAATAIWQITSNASLALPQLLTDLPGLDASIKLLAIRTLGDMGPQAKGAVPLLLNEWAQARTGAASGRGRFRGPLSVNDITNALQAIDPEAAVRPGTNDEQ